MSNTITIQLSQERHSVVSPIKHSANSADRLSGLLLPLLIPVGVISLWIAGSKNGLFNTSVIPTPDMVSKAFSKLLKDGLIWQHIGSSLGRVLRGYLLGTTFGMLVGIVAAMSRQVNRMLSLIIGLLRPIPAIALIPFFILWLGIKEQSKIGIITVGSFWPVLLNTMQGVGQTDEKLLEVGKLFGKNKVETFFQIIFPDALPSIFTGWRLGISSAWVCVVTAEMIAASRGVGYMISYGRELAQPAMVLIGIAAIGLIGLIIDQVFLRLQKRVIFWRGADKKE